MYREYKKVLSKSEGKFIEIDMGEFQKFASSLSVSCKAQHRHEAIAEIYNALNIK